MFQISHYGNHRSLEPKSAFPNFAWKVDNSMNLFDNEILVKVSLINIDGDSFKQIYVECEGNKDKISKKILDIIELRGKLHNPITGTGGTLYGEITKIGTKAEGNFSIGDKVISLSSLTITPIKINKIINIDSHFGQIEVDGYAILFSSGPLMKVSEDIPLKLLLSVLDEAGAPIQTYNLTNPNYNIAIIGASGELGLMCGFAARKKLESSGRIIGIRSINGNKSFKAEVQDVFDDIYYCDIMKPLETLSHIKKHEKDFDLVINCTTTLGSEILSLLLVKEFGTIYLSTLGSNYKSLSSTAEGMSKDVNIIGYKGFSKNHASFTINLLKDYPLLAHLLNKRLEQNYREESITNKLSPSSDIESNILKDINLENFVFKSKSMQKVLDNAFKVANYDCTVLITGESGVGKEIIAKIVHMCSNRSHIPSIKINCGSIPKDLLESELFGYEKGAFTGANSSGKIGFFELANNSTLFLDEVGELPLDLQVKLLRAIQEKEIYRVGSTKPISIDVRLIAATNKDLKKLVEEGKFREDLYYRLNVFPIEIPPLRQRKSAIIPLANHFIDMYNKKFNLEKKLNSDALEYLKEYNWPGNIRELENFIQRLLISSDSNCITISDVARFLHSTSLETTSNILDVQNKSLNDILDEVEFSVLKSAKEKYKTTRQIAAALNLSQPTLVRKLNKHDL